MSAAEFPYPGDDPAGLSGVVGTFDANTTNMHSVASGVAQATKSLDANWKSDAATEAGHDLTTLKRAIQLASRAFGDGSSAVSHYRSELISIRGEVDGLRRQLKSKEAVLSAQVTEYARADRFGEFNDMTPAQIASYRVDIAGDEKTTRSAISGLHTQYQALVTRANTAADTCSAALTATISAKAYNGSTLVTAGIEQTLGLTNLGLLQDYIYDAANNPPHWPAGKSPAAVKAYWDSLPPGLRAAYIRLYPGQVGNLDGVPVIDRDQANRIALPAAITSLTGQLATLRGQEPSRRLLAPNWMQSSAWQRWNSEMGRLKSQLAGANGVQKALNSSTQPPQFLIGFDTNGNGHAIISANNPDTSANVATFVTGTGTKTSGMTGDVARSQLMLRSAQKAGAGSTAVVTWYGYDAPQSLPAAAHRSYAQAGAPRLDNFQAGLRATHVGPPSYNTVIGHSYGTTVVGEAAGHGRVLDADNVVFVASPGTSVNHASDLNLQGSPGSSSNVYATVAAADPIRKTPVIGPAPIKSSYGAHDFSSDPDRGSWVVGGMKLSAHGNYWSVNNKALRNLGLVIAGRGGETS